MSDSPKTAPKHDDQLPMTTAEMLAAEAGQDTRVARWALGIAIIFHVIIFAMHWPSFASGLSDAKEKKNKIYVVRQVKFKQPPRREMQQILKPKTQKVPIPDPTPDRRINTASWATAGFARTTYYCRKSIFGKQIRN